MSQDFSNAAGPPPGSNPSAPASGRFDLRQLRRSRDDRMIGGVCGGLGRYVGIDPIIFRIVLAALAIFGGVGLLIYALAWLLIPDDGTDLSELHRLVQGHPSPAPVIAAIIVGVIGVFVVTEVAYHRRGRFEVLLIVVAVIAVIALSSRTHSVPPSTVPPSAAPPQPPYAAPPTYPASAPQAAPAASAPLYATPQYVAPQYGAAGYTAPQYSAPQYSAPLGPPAGYAPSRPVYTPPPNYVPPPPKPPRPPSFLGPISLSVGVVMIGVLFALDASQTIELSAQAIFAASLLTVGLALVVGTWIGRARALIAFGAILAIALALTAAVDVPLRGGVGGRYYSPATAADIPAAYHLGIGRQTIDLTGLDLAGKTVLVTSTVGVGVMHIDVPSNVKVLIHGRTGAGDVEIDGDDVSGNHVDRTFVLAATAPAVAGEIDLDLRVGVGQVIVDRDFGSVPEIQPSPPPTPTPTSPAAPTLGSGGLTQP